jgi:hypothetical protein
MTRLDYLLDWLTSKTLNKAILLGITPEAIEW